MNIEDSEECGKKILEMVLGNLAVTIFAMQRGVRGTSEFKDMFDFLLSTNQPINRSFPLPLPLLILIYFSIFS